MHEHIRRLSEVTSLDVALAGGKGASLGEMTRAGFPVPPGFVILAPAFDQFLRETDLTQEIDGQLKKVNYDDIASVERASRVIHDLIHDARFSQGLEVEILAAFKKLKAPLVAVRSSATAEDSSVASWAGELETYLNTTEKILIGNIKKCWASLFTPRAIVYRNEKGMRNTHVSVAVVIQKMVQSEVAGVAFTVHPVTKDSNQMIIEACWGLGELLVGGEITPDSYVINKKTSAVIDTNLSEQDEMLVRGPAGNKRIPVPSAQKSKPKLDAKQLKELTTLCLKIENHYGFPCDIEWAFADETFHILQSRPITTL